MDELLVYTDVNHNYILKQAKTKHWAYHLGKIKVFECSFHKLLINTNGKNTEL